MDRLWQSIAEKQEEAARLTSLAAAELVQLNGLMGDLKLGTYQFENIYATRAQSTGRATNFIDPAAFRKECASDKEFYGAVTVSITEAKAILPGKVLEKIIETKPAKPGPYTTKVSRKVK